jgi:DNA polymerase-4/protein ImuB
MDFLCMLIPRFLVAIARRDTPALQSRPVIVGQASETRGNVLSCSEEASRTGVAPGMLISRAQVLCPSAAVVPLREGETAAAARAFVELLKSLCPSVEEVEPGHIHADIQGMARMNGLSHEAYISDLQETVALDTELPVRAGGAETLFAAHAAASYLANPACYLTRDQRAAALAPLPVETLPLSDEMLRRLHLFGLERLEQLAELPPSALQAQFGRPGLQAWRLIRGDDPGRLQPDRDEITVTERITLPAPAVLSAPLVLGTQIVMQRALRHPEIDGRSLRRADWVATLENDERLPLRFVFREPTADADQMLFVIRNALERLTLPAPATDIALTLSGICSEYARQERLWQTGPRGQESLGSAIEQLNVRTGGPQVYRVVEVEPWSRIPERQRALAAYSP